MLPALYALLFLSGAYPLYRAWAANRQTSLLQAVNWAVGVWLLWGVVLYLDVVHGSLGIEARYVALGATGCAGVAVLGARRPGVGPWNFVVIGLLAVLLLPLGEAVVAGKELRLDGFRTFFLSATLAVGILNYLPTRLGVAALLLGVGCAAELYALVTPGPLYRRLPGTDGWFLAVVWVAFALLHFRAPASSAFDTLWLDFRDRFGLVWSQRLREQFNRSAHHAGWPVVLRWQGVRLVAGASLPEPAVQAEMLATLRALMKRFGPEEYSSAPSNPPS